MHCQQQHSNNGPLSHPQQQYVLRTARLGTHHQGGPLGSSFLGLTALLRAASSSSCCQQYHGFIVVLEAAVRPLMGHACLQSRPCPSKALPKLHSPLLAGRRDGRREALLSYHPALPARVLSSLILVAVACAWEVTLVVACVHKLGVRPHSCDCAPAGPSVAMQEVRLWGSLTHQLGPAPCRISAKARRSLSEKVCGSQQATANTCCQHSMGPDLAPP